MVVRCQLLAPATSLLVLDRKLVESQDPSGCKSKRKAIFTSAENGKGHAVAQLVEALRYKSEGRGFDARRYHWNFSLT